MSSCLWTPLTSTCLLVPPSISSPSFTTLFMSKSLSVFHSIYRFLPRRTGMWCCITAWPPPLRGQRSTLSHSWHLATMCSSIYLLPSWLRASRPRWVIIFFFLFCLLLKWQLIFFNCATLKVSLIPFRHCMWHSISLLTLHSWHESRCCSNHLLTRRVAKWFVVAVVANAS